MDGEFSTKTGRLLRDSFQPLLSVLRLLDMQANDSSRGKCLVIKVIDTCTKVYAGQVKDPMDRVNV